MAGDPNPYSLGIEEEFQIVDPATRDLRAGAQELLPRAEAGEREVQLELYQSMIEIASPVCGSLGEARAQVARLRRSVIRAAEQGGARIAAAGTHPFGDWADQELTPGERYQRTHTRFQQLGRELLIYGCHVHVGVPDRETALEVLNRSRIWLSCLIALTANSPFWLGRDTEIWTRFPMAGPPNRFESLAEYEELIDTLLGGGMVLDRSRIYWDLRIPAVLPTVEFRCTDVCLSIDETVMVAGLCRALARTCREAAERGEPVPRVRQEVLRCAHWQAARWGLTGGLVNALAGRVAPAADVIEEFLRFLRPALEANGDWDEVAALTRETLERGTGARRQREVFERTGRLEAVVDYVVEETARGT
jgi:carboxylate-amine ligase